MENIISNDKLSNVARIEEIDRRYMQAWGRGDENATQAAFAEMKPFLATGEAIAFSYGFVARYAKTGGR